jgi:tetratricopeptide (TPR) repeat protein
MIFAQGIPHHSYVLAIFQELSSSDGTLDKEALLARIECDAHKAKTSSDAELLCATVQAKGLVFMKFDKIEEAKACFQEAWQQARTCNPKLFFYSMLKTRISLHHTHEAIQLTLETLDYIKEPLDQCRLFIILAAFYMYLQLYELHEEQLNNAQAILKQCSKKQKSTPEFYKQTINLLRLYAELYTYLRQPDKVEQYHKDIENLIEEYKHLLAPDYIEHTIYSMLYIVASNYITTQQYTQAIATYHKLFEQCDIDAHYHRRIHYNLALAYVEVGDIAKAEPLLTQVETWNREYSFDPDSYFLTMCTQSLRAGIASKSGQLEEALQCFQSAEKLALEDDQHHDFFLTELYQLWIKCLRSAGHLEEACNKYEQYCQVKDKLHQQRLQESGLAAEASFQTQFHKEKSKHLAARKNELQKKMKQQQQRLQHFGVVRRKWRDLSHIIFYSTLGFVFRLV